MGKLRLGDICFRNLHCAYRRRRRLVHASGYIAQRSQRQIPHLKHLVSFHKNPVGIPPEERSIPFDAPEGVGFMLLGSSQLAGESMKTEAFSQTVAPLLPSR
jgi:hypothetical protein